MPAAYVSQGCVFERAPGQPGSRYVWTRKVRAKTVTVALSREQSLCLKQAAANQRNLERIVERMQKLSRQILFEDVPGMVRRNYLTRKVSGLNQGPFRSVPGIETILPCRVVALIFIRG